MPQGRPCEEVGDRVLVTGWFSWPDCAATAGDLLARDVACAWLERAGRGYDVANAEPFGDGVDWRAVDPCAYSEVVFVCGPVGRGWAQMQILERFPHSRHIGVNLTMLEPPSDWNPFDALIERDSSVASRPELSFASREPAVPVVGLVLVEPHSPENPGRDRQEAARAAVERLRVSRPAAWVPIDTRLDVNATGLRTPAEVESLIARMDAVVTTRLHGLVLALKNGVPALAIDPVAGGGKIRQQADAVGWPFVRTADALDDGDLNAALDSCLGEEARATARACAERALGGLEQVEREFAMAVSLATPPGLA